MRVDNIIPPDEAIQTFPAFFDKGDKLIDEHKDTEYTFQRPRTFQNKEELDGFIKRVLTPKN